MDSYHIRGGKRLEGNIKLHGSKNAALPILAATIVTGGESFIENCPKISDVIKMKHILETLGCTVRDEDGGVYVDTRNVSSWSIPETLMKTMRSSIFLSGGLLGRFGKTKLSQPGGCKIGARPIDIHLEGFRRLGATIEETENEIICTTKGLEGASIYLPFPSVGATENIILAAMYAEGETTIKNCAMEPEIVDLQRYLIGSGAEIKGAGTDTISIIGKRNLHSQRHSIIPDRIEGGTFLCAAAATAGEIFLENGVWEHSEALSAFLAAAGCRVEKAEKGIYIAAPRRLKAVNKITTGPFPGFPTDMQPQAMAIMAMADGESRIKEEIFESRFGIAKELNKMGAAIEIDRKCAIIRGVYPLMESVVCAEDLRGGAALVIAALGAEGKSCITNVEHISRGYFEFDKNLRRLGADIEINNND